jgi:hypothetical protein
VKPYLPPLVAFLPALVVCGCAADRNLPAPTADQVIGTWQLVGGSRGDSIISLKMAITLRFSEGRGDSVFGQLTLWMDPSAPNDSGYAPLLGVRAPGSRLEAVAPVTDSSEMDMMIEGRVKEDSLFVYTFRPRSGANVLPGLSWLLFVRAVPRAA